LSDSIIKNFVLNELSHFIGIYNMKIKYNIDRLIYIENENNKINNSNFQHYFTDESSIIKCVSQEKKKKPSNEEKKNDIYCYLRKIMIEIIYKNNSSNLYEKSILETFFKDKKNVFGNLIEKKQQTYSRLIHYLTKPIKYIMHKIMVSMVIDLFNVEAANINSDYLITINNINLELNYLSVSLGLYNTNKDRNNISGILKTINIKSKVVTLIMRVIVCGLLQGEQINTICSSINDKLNTLSNSDNENIGVIDKYINIHIKEIIIKINKYLIGYDEKKIYNNSLLNSLNNILSKIFNNKESLYESLTSEISDKDNLDYFTNTISSYDDNLYTSYKFKEDSSFEPNSIKKNEYISLNPMYRYLNETEDASGEYDDEDEYGGNETEDAGIDDDDEDDEDDGNETEDAYIDDDDEDDEDDILED
jgi:hypothetical protein